jgi:hypothetical protein
LNLELRNSGKKGELEWRTQKTKMTPSLYLLEIFRFSSVPEFLSSRFIIVPLPCLPYSLKNPFKIAKSQDSKHPTTFNA